jgi:sigma-B regulation protein RsbU (phosphoserine phosphatase)
VQYVNAGHNPPYLLQPGAEIVEVKATGTPIGMLEEAPFAAGELTIEPGGLLFLFSDGIPEAQNADGEFYEEDRLRACLCRDSGRPAEAIVDCVKSDLDAFVGETPPTDDVTMLILKRLPLDG